MSGWTPGPWRVVADTTLVGPKGNVVAECYGYSDRATDPVQRAQGGRESNARLIAEAPAMVEALRDLLSWADPDSVPGEFANRSYDCARAILARIEERV